MSWHELQAEIMIDQLSGAASITGLVGHLLLEILNQEHFASIDSIYDVLQSTSRQLLTAQSGMTSLVSLFNRAFFSLSGEHEVDAATLKLQESVRAFISEQESAQRTIGRTASALIPFKADILTHSASSTVLQTLLIAAQAGRRPQVTCTESRPLYEGRQLAIQLGQKGVAVRLIVDSAIYANLQHPTEIVLLGADSMTEQGVIAKVGAAGLAVAAQKLGVPFYFLADTSKIWPQALGVQPVHERPPRDVWPDAPENIRLQNPFFDTTPWETVSGVITEQGLLMPVEILHQGRNRPVHKLLYNVMADVRSST